MSKNGNLHQAKRAKNDEFYTQLSDIEKECKHYKQYFNGKIILCNCNDALHTGFATYFSLNFEILGLKELICTSYSMGGGHGFVYRYHGDKNSNGIPDIEEWDKQELEGNGGFNTHEGIELIKEADIIVTNPPFSLFREFVATLEEYGKKYLILGNMNAITYKEIFPLIKENKMWLGCSLNATKCHFLVSDDYENSNVFTESGLKKAKVNNAIWFTNIDHAKRHEPLDLYKRYTCEEYPKYDNYDAINVDKVCDIPMDYDGVIGVPITFLIKYCPEQFEIIWTTDRGGDGVLDYIKFPHPRYDAPVVNGKGLYKRIFIKLI